CGTSSRSAIRRSASSPFVRRFGPTSACATWRRWPSSCSRAKSGPTTRSGRARRLRQARYPQSWGARPDDLISAGHLISERVMLKNDRFFAVSARDGSMKPGEFAGDGLWSGDTRILSTLRFVSDGHRTAVIAQAHGLKHRLRREPGEEFVLTLDVVPGSGPATLDFASGLRAARDIYPRWAAECMSVRTDNPVLNELLDQAIADIRMLSNSYDTGIYPT